ncbi:AmmeMemoRadiSam system protein B, partial [Candidatus Bathyarchaeota archaeon]
YDKEFKIVPITVGYGDYDMCEDVGDAIAEAAKDLGRDIVVLGSTDFTHYGAMYGYTPAGTRPFEKVLKWVYETDRSLIEKIVSLDAEGLVRRVRENNYTMCGYLPVATMIVAAKKMGASEGKLLKYATSYDVQGSTDVIVGYASIVIEK